MQELQQQAQVDKEAFKYRVAEAEKKAKEADTRRTQMIFDFEKEKARWQMEYDDVVNQHRELDDVIATLKKEEGFALQRERTAQGRMESWLTRHGK